LELGGAGLPGLFQGAKIGFQLGKSRPPYARYQAEAYPVFSIRFGHTKEPTPYIVSLQQAILTHTRWDDNEEIDKLVWGKVWRFVFGN